MIKTPAQQAREIADEIIRLTNLPNWDAHIFQLSALKFEFKQLIDEHKLTPHQILSCKNTTINSF